MLSIGSLNLKTPFILAPLAGYTDLPFRILCNRLGAGLSVSEMISCHGLYYNQEKTVSMLQTNELDTPVSFQLFGSEPEIMASAADRLNAYHPDIIDINMGCPVRKVTKKGAGAALMETPKLAEKIIKEVVKNSEKPVTVKFRSGVNFQAISAVDFGKMCQDNGVKAVTVHGRTWSQAFTGLADWGVIQDVKKALAIPVIGNGDVTSHSTGIELMNKTGCDGIMIGRAALGNPWVFSQAGKPHDLPSVYDMVLIHMDLMQQYLPVDRMLGCLKNHLGRYFKDFPGSSSIRKTIYSTPTFDQLYATMQRLASESR